MTISTRARGNPRTSGAVCHENGTYGSNREVREIILPIDSNNPTGLFATVRSLESSDNKNDKHLTPVVYVGDTVADMYTVKQARLQEPSRTWIGVGVLPPHVQQILARRDAYAEKLIDAGASMVFTNVQHLSLLRISELVNETGFEEV